MCRNCFLCEGFIFQEKFVDIDGQNKKDKNYLQTTTQKNKDRLTQIPLKTGSELMCC